MKTTKWKDVRTHLLDGLCFSMYDGCVCALDKGHWELHYCGNAGCGDSWSDEDAAWESYLYYSRPKNHCFLDVRDVSLR